MSRHYLFRKYWWIAMLGVIIGVSVVLRLAGSDRTSLMGSVIAGSLALCYFVQAQKLAEIANSGEPVDPTTRQIVVDFFNLCAEEYLWFSEGYIHRDVWRSWCAGMLSYFNREPFRTA